MFHFELATPGWGISWKVHPSIHSYNLKIWKITIKNVSCNTCTALKYLHRNTNFTFYKWTLDNDRPHFPWEPYPAVSSHRVNRFFSSWGHACRLQLIAWHISSVSLGSSAAVSCSDVVVEAVPLDMELIPHSACLLRSLTWTEASPVRPDVSIGCSGSVCLKLENIFLSICPSLLSCALPFILFPFATFLSPLHFVDTKGYLSIFLWGYCMCSLLVLKLGTKICFGFQGL